MIDIIKKKLILYLHIIKSYLTPLKVTLSLRTSSAKISDLPRNYSRSAVGHQLLRISE